MPGLERRFVRFAARALLIGAVLLVPWPGLGAAFTRGLGAVANVVVAPMRWHVQPPLGLGPERTLAIGFRPALEADAAHVVPNPAWHTVLAIRDVDTGAATRSAINVRYLVYVPLAIFTALTLAAPIERSRRWACSVALGLAFLAAFVSLSLALPVFDALSDDRVRGIELDATTKAQLGTVYLTLIEMGSANTIVLWAIARWLTKPRGHWLWLEAPR
jgi:hypothetical protein